MPNLLTETVDNLAEHEKSPADVRWVGSRSGDFVSGWDEFAALAAVDYDADFGSNEVPMDLVVVGDGWWLERHEYDGSEWWEFKALPAPQVDARKMERIIPGRSWGLFPDSLKSVHDEENRYG